MRPYAAAPLPFMTDGCPAGRGPVRVPMAEPLPRRSGVAGAQPICVKLRRAGYGSL